jgi:ferritin-like metal-binding protein YciE
MGAPVARDTKDAINSYVTDMLALEQHIEKALRGQFQDLKDYPDVVTELRQAHRIVEHHISDLKGLKDRHDAGGVADALKRAGSVVAGAGAAAIDLLRTEGLPKDLRDDYTAFNLATIGYVMLHTTALALGDQEVASLARQGFTDYANVVTRLHNLTPAAVIRYLQEEGLPASDAVLPEISRTINQVWERTPDQSPTADRTATARNL